MAKSVTVTLGGKAYTVAALPIRQSKVWRDKLAQPFTQITHALEGAGTVEINQFGDIAGLVRSLSGTLLGAIDTVLELMFDYSPELAADRDAIEENAYDEEALDAFAAILGLVYPFGRLLAVVSGRQETRTLPNSPSRNGASGTPKRSEKHRAG